MPSRRRLVLAGVLVFVAVLTTAILSEVIATVFFGITVAYVLYPVRQWFVDRGASARLASALASLAALVALLLVVAPLALILYRRRNTLFTLLENLPDEVTITLGELTHVVDVEPILAELQTALGSLARSLAGAAPVLMLKLTLLGFVVYGLLVHPEAPRRVVLDLVPAEYHDIVRALHGRVRETLNAIYVLQAATAAATFALALLVFAVLGYGAPFVLAFVAAVLQFIPIVGPSLLVLALAVNDVVVGNPTRAVAVAVLGLVVVGFLPDAVVRPRLAERTADLPASVYFVGFTGGILSLGVVGFIAGPLAVALFVEVVLLFTAGTGRQSTFAETPSARREE